MTPKLISEFVGTFFLVLTIGLTVLIGTEFAPIAIGVMLTAMVYMGGHISGAHYNPAVTLAVWMRGKMPTSEIAPYMVAQLLGAMGGAFAAYIVNDRTLQVVRGAETTTFEFFLLEFLFTFALVLVILNVATTRGTAGNSYYGLAIGFTVMAGAFAAGPVSGGAFNPAVALGPILIDVLFGEGASLRDLWLYLVSTFSGGALAALVFRAQNPDEMLDEIADDAREAAA